MTTTRTITVHDHEVSVRTVVVSDEPKAAPYTAITGGRRTAAWTVAVGALVVAVALMPALTALFH